MPNTSLSLTNLVYVIVSAILAEIKVSRTATKATLMEPTTIIDSASLVLRLSSKLN